MYIPALPGKRLTNLGSFRVVVASMACDESRHFSLLCVKLARAATRSSRIKQSMGPARLSPDRKAPGLVSPLDQTNVATMRQSVFLVAWGWSAGQDSTCVVA